MQFVRSCTHFASSKFAEITGLCQSKHQKNISLKACLEKRRHLANAFIPEISGTPYCRVHLLSLCRWMQERRKRTWLSLVFTHTKFWGKEPLISLLVILQWHDSKKSKKLIYRLLWGVMSGYSKGSQLCFAEKWQKWRSKRYLQGISSWFLRFLFLQ